jgi:choline dehydrogenase-like flavoprotein
LGANLSLHPSTSVLALFDESVEGWNGVPQGYAVEEFHREGILIEGAFAPLDYGSMSIPLIGPILMELMESYGKTANFGYMIHDSSRGRVRPGIAGRPLITYNMNRRDVALMQRALVKLCEIYFAAGARTVYPIIQGFEVLRTADELESIRNAQLKPHHFEMIGFHPLGTARMGLNPATSVVDHTHETHEVKNLFIADGSVVPTSLAVNPQITIMTLATRAADFIDRRLS